VSEIADSVINVGLVDGSVPASTRRFHVVLADDAVAQLDELVATTQTLPDGTGLTHYGIVVEGTGQIEGAELPSDTGRITRDHTMPGITTRRVEVEILRTVPELWLAPAPGAPVVKATGAGRELALFISEMMPKLARKAVFAIPLADLSGNEDQVARLNRGHVIGDRRHRVRQLDGEFGQAGIYFSGHIGIVLLLGAYQDSAPRAGAKHWSGNMERI